MDDASPDRVLMLGLGYWASRALLCAIELDVFSALADGPRDCDGIRGLLRLHERGAHDFLDTLVALRMLNRHEGLYFNSRQAQLFLDRHSPSYLGDHLASADKQLYRNWRVLPEVLRTGRPRTGVKKGGDLFAATYNDPAAIALFLRRMTEIILPTARALARQFPWKEYRTFADIGTGEGALPVEIARAHPHLTGGGLDRPVVRPAFDAYVRQHGPSTRLRFHAGDLVNDPFPSADVFVLGEILREWDQDTKLALLKKAYDALPRSGALIVYDQIIDDERRSNVAALLTSLNMRVHTPDGFGYTGGNCIAWMREVGFNGLRWGHLFGPHSMVVGTK